MVVCVCGFMRLSVVGLNVCVFVCVSDNPFECMFLLLLCCLAVSACACVYVVCLCVRLVGCLFACEDVCVAV